MGEWIFCGDELPEEDGEYLVVWYMPDYTTQRRFYEIQEYSEGEWAIHMPQAGKQRVIIEAWQKLPALPEEA